jgi:release factor glutamine methyltransferase
MITRTVSLPMTHSTADEPTIAATLARAATQLQATGAPRLEAELLLAHVLDLSRASLYAHPNRAFPAHQRATYQTLVNRRALGEPLPYLIGHVEFYGLNLSVNTHVLIPRPETETLVDLALTLQSHSAPLQGLEYPISNIQSFADVCTGSGCIAIALAVHAPQARVYALDLSPGALAVARANAARHGVGDRVTFLQSDLLAALPEPVDLIVANPPYIAAQEWGALPREVREHEPRLALDGGPDGLDVIRRLLDQSPAHLRLGGALLMEMGAAQGAAVAHLARRAYPSAVVTIRADLAGRDRVLCVQTHPDTNRENEL